MPQLTPAPTCDELREEELEELRQIYNCMVKVTQTGRNAGEVEVEEDVQMMTRVFFGLHASNSHWRAKEVWDKLLKKPIPLSNGRCVICVVKEYDKFGNPCEGLITAASSDQ